MTKIKKNNIVNFPENLNSGDREVEAIIFAAAEPLDIETIETRVSKKINVPKSLERLQKFYSKRGINLVCISKKWSFRTSPNLSNLMKQEKTPLILTIFLKAPMSLYQFVPRLFRANQPIKILDPCELSSFLWPNHQM